MAKKNYIFLENRYNVITLLRVEAAEERKGGGNAAAYGETEIRRNRNTEKEKYGEREIRRIEKGSAFGAA